MEDVIYDDINDYIGYLPFFLGYSWMGLGTFSYNYGDARSYHPYGACLWPIFLTEKYNDPGIVREVWESCGQIPGYNALYAMESSLQSRSSGLNASLQEFTVWNFHSGDFADPSRYFSEGTMFPEVDTAKIMANLDIMPEYISFPPNPPEFMGANYIIVDTNAKPGGLRINFDGDDISGAEWYVALLGYWPFQSQWRDMGVGYNNGAGTEEWRDWDFYQSIIVIPTVSGLTPIHSQFFSYDGWVVYDQSLTGDPDLTGGTRLYSPYPSPFVISSGGSSVTIPYSLQQRYPREDIYLRLYDASGGVVREFSFDVIPATSPGYHATGLIWDGTNNDNEYVASGIYILHMEAGDKSSHVKIAVVNGN